MTLKQLNSLPIGSKTDVYFGNTECLLTVHDVGLDIPEKYFMIVIFNTDCSPRENEYWLKITGTRFRFQAWIGGESCLEEMQSKSYPLRDLKFLEEYIAYKN